MTTEAGPTGTEADAIGGRRRVERLEVRAADGVRAQATVYLPERGGGPLVVCTPAMGVPARFYDKLGDELAGGGATAVVGELRGIDTSSVRARRGVDFGYRELVACDLPALVAAARPLQPAAPLILFGHSLGGQVSALYASQHPADVAGVVLVASGTPYWRAWPFPYNAGLLGFSFLARATAATLGYFPGNRLGFGGTEARRLMRQWARVVTHGHFAIPDLAADVEAGLATVTLPLLAISIAGDKYAPRAAVDHLANKLPRAALTRVHLDAEELEPSALDHFRWARKPAPVVARVLAWAAALDGAAARVEAR